MLCRIQLVWREKNKLFRQEYFYSSSVIHTELEGTVFYNGYFSSPLTRPDIFKNVETVSDLQEKRMRQTVSTSPQICRINKETLLTPRSSFAHSRMEMRKQQDKRDCLGHVSCRRNLEDSTCCVVLLVANSTHLSRYCTFFSNVIVKMETAQKCKPTNHLKNVNPKTLLAPDHITHGITM